MTTRMTAQDGTSSSRAGAARKGSTRLKPTAPGATRPVRAEPHGSTHLATHGAPPHVPEPAYRVDLAEGSWLERTHKYARAFLLRALCFS